MKLHRSFLIAFTILQVLLLLFKADAAPAKKLETFKNCTFVKTSWADGDSFQIKRDTGELHTVRLYGVDCIELHLGDDRNINRFREQRRYFGISEAGKSNEESMKIASVFAQDAAEFTAKCLEKPFSLHTRFTNGRGDPKFPRIYGFITLADGRDLGTLLVQEGLARAQGTNSTMPDGTSMTEAIGMLEDWEIQALKKARGIWAKTNWEKLPTERQILRKEKAEAQIAKQQNAPNPNIKINPNTATKEQLDALPGIGPTLADRIISESKKALFQKPADLLRVDNLNNKVLEQITPFLEFSKK
jgi:DNA uptake protein ComE-like DNA-binding protein